MKYIYSFKLCEDKITHLCYVIKNNISLRTSLHHISIAQLSFFVLLEILKEDTLLGFSKEIFGKVQDVLTVHDNGEENQHRQERLHGSSWANGDTAEGGDG